MPADVTHLRPHQIREMLPPEDVSEIREKLAQFSFEATIYIIGTKEPVPVRAGENTLKTPVSFVVRPNSIKARNTMLASYNAANWCDLHILAERRVATTELAELVLSEARALLEWAGLPLKMMPRRGCDVVVWCDIELVEAIKTLETAARTNSVELYSPKQAETHITAAAAREIEMQRRRRRT